MSNSNTEYTPFLSRHVRDAFRFSVAGIQQLFEKMDVRVPPHVFAKIGEDNKVIRWRDERRISLTKRADGTYNARLINGKNKLWIGAKEVQDFIPEPV